MVDDEDVFFLGNRLNLQDFNVFFIVFRVNKNLSENLLKVILILDSFNGPQSLKVVFNLLDIGFFLLPKDIRFVLVTNHSCDQDNFVASKDTFYFS